MHTLTASKMPSTYRCILYIAVFLLSFVIGFYDWDGTDEKILDQKETLINPYNGNREKVRIHAYLSEKKNGSLVVYLSNINPWYEVSVNSISINDNLIALPESIVLPRLVAGIIHHYSRHVINTGMSADEIELNELLLNFTSNGTSYKTIISKYDMQIDESQLPGFYQKKTSLFEGHEFLSILNETIEIKTGVWDIDENLVIPNGYKLVAHEDTTLRLHRGASLISFSPIIFKGSKKKPIQINCGGVDSGIAVIQAGKESTLDHVLFNACSSPRVGGWQLSGAVTFYESPVGIKSTEFRENLSEDSLNIVRSNFFLVDSVIQSSQSDAFDGDFVEGEVIRTKFLNCGNDCIDVSGSDIRIIDSSIFYAGDKGISIGEKSNAIVRGTNIKATNIGIASKDLSKVIAENVSISSSNIALAAYQKKSEYGGGYIKYERSVIEDVTTDYLIEYGSSLIGLEMEVNHKNNVYKIINGQ